MNDVKFEYYDGSRWQDALTIDDSLADKVAELEGRVRQLERERQVVRCRHGMDEEFCGYCLEEKPKPPKPKLRVMRFE